VVCTWELLPGEHCIYSLAKQYYLTEAICSFKDGNELDYRLNKIHMCCSLMKNYWLCNYMLLCMGYLHMVNVCIATRYAKLLVTLVNVSGFQGCALAKKLLLWRYYLNGLGSSVNPTLRGSSRITSCERIPLLSMCFVRYKTAYYILLQIYLGRGDGGMVSWSKRSH